MSTLPPLEKTTRDLAAGRFWLPGLDQSEGWGGDISGRTRLPTLHLLVAASMRARARGDLQRAWRLLQDGLRLLPRGFVRLDADGVPRRIELAPLSSGGDDLARWTHRTACVMARELAQMEGMLERFTRPRPPVDEWIDTGVEYLCRVEFVPMWWSINDDHMMAVRVDTGRGALHRRVNHARKFANATAGDLTTHAWRRLGGYQGLRAAALRRLAEEPLTEWADRPCADDIPVDEGRHAAWSFAHQGTPSPGTG